MKSAKPKYVNPTVRTVGQWSCGGAKSAFSTNPIGLQNVSGGEPVKPEADEDSPWSKLHRTFSNSQTLKSYNHQDHSRKENAYFGTFKDEPETTLPHQTTPTRDMATTELCASVNRKTSETGVQVNMFHCQECRRHIKYGKTFKPENSCTESDSESNLLASNVCTTCEREENTISLSTVDGIGGDGEDVEKSACEDCSHQHHTTCNLCDCTPQCEKNSPSPRSGGDTTSQDYDIGSKIMIISQMKGGKQIWLSNITFMTVAIVTISLILYFVQIQIFGATISKINFYIRNMMRQEETEEESSVFGWILDLLFGVHGNAKPHPLFFYLF